MIVWQNPRPSSTRFCRPVKMEYTKETIEVVLQERENIVNEINELTATKCEIISGETNFSVDVEHKLG